MPPVTCHACGTTNELRAGSLRCGKCGVALPSPAGESSRNVLEGPLSPAVSVFEEMVEDEEFKDGDNQPSWRQKWKTIEWERARKQAFTLLYSIAGLQLLCGAGVFFMADDIPGARGISTTSIAMIMFVVAIVFVGL